MLFSWCSTALQQAAGRLAGRVAGPVQVLAIGAIPALERHAIRRIDPHHRELVEALLVGVADGVDLPVRGRAALVPEEKDTRRLAADDAAGRLPLAVAIERSQAVGKAWRHFARKKLVPRPSVHLARAEDEFGTRHRRAVRRTGSCVGLRRR